MRNLFFAAAMIVCMASAAQEKPEKANVFVRVYDLQDKKIAKGKILSITDTTLQLQGIRELINVHNIGVIRTRHSHGHNIMIGAAAGATIGAVYGIASAEPDSWIGLTAGEGAAMGVFLGSLGGSLIGWISSICKESNSYIINGDQLQFKEFNSTMSGSEH